MTSGALEAQDEAAAAATLETPLESAGLSTRALSALHLETVLSAKMISKTSQAIEKLTNLS